MRISRPRLLLRAGLLLAGGALMGWRAVTGWPGLRGDALQAVLALVQGLMGVLAFVAAAVAVRALRPRPRRHTLRLPAPPGAPRAEPSAAGEAPSQEETP